jgi:DMSO reductase family type II enzyme chaperone
MSGADALAESGDRARVYRALAGLFREQDEAGLEALRQGELRELEEALARLEAGADVVEAARDLVAVFADADLERLRRAYQESFEASGGLHCPAYETSHTADTPQQGLTRTFEMADVAGFYRAFGVEVAPGGERPDHVAAELEFMHLLAVKELIARGEDGSVEHAEICHDAARAFLRDHLGRWAGRLAARLEETGADPAYVAAGRLLDRFVVLDATRFGVN